MPESRDDLPHFLDAPRRAGLRELFRHDVTVVSCALWRNAAPWRLEWRQCGDTFLLLPVKGSFRVHLRDRRPFTIAPGRFLLLPEGVWHALEISPGQRHLHQFSVHFHLHDSWKRSLMNRMPAVAFRLPDPKETTEALGELTCLMKQDNDTGQALGAALVHTLLAQQLRRHTLAGDGLPAGDHRVGLALERMEAELGSAGLSVEALARGVELTPVQFRKLFRRDLGEGPKEFLQRLRLRRAQWLLRHTHAPVKDVAARCGFGSDHYFHLVFRREFHKTPSAYRRGAPAEV